MWWAVVRQAGSSAELDRSMFVQDIEYWYSVHLYLGIENGPLLSCFLNHVLRCHYQAEDNRAQTIYRAGKSSIWDTRLHELEDMGIGVALYFQFLKVTPPETRPRQPLSNHEREGRGNSAPLA